MIEQAVAEKAAIMTGIGLATAFGILVLLMVLIGLLSLATRRFLHVAEPGTESEPLDGDAEAKNKALAAVVAVAALLTRQRGRVGSRSGG